MTDIDLNMPCVL